MKKKFADFILAKDFKSAAELIFDATFDIQVPKNVNLIINREKNIIDLAKQMESCYYQVDDTYSELDFDTLWTNVFQTTELSEKKHLKGNDMVVAKAKLAFDEVMTKFKIQQYEQIFVATTGAVNIALQEAIDAAINL